MDEEVRESYFRLESRLFHKGRFITPSFIEAKNMLLTFQAVGLKPFLTLDEPICLRFVSLDSLDDHPNSRFFGPKHDLVKKNITIPRTTQTQLQRDPNKLHIDDIRPELRGWELFLGKISFAPLAIEIMFMFHDRVMNPLDILRNPIKEKGKRVASPSVSSSSSSSSDGNEAPSFLEFYEELFDNEDLTDA
ncbi:hypothetical protein Tco_0404309 [Tanacetum coccineum]